ncbi:MAG: glycoside hydrolase family 130 protein [Phycisphaerae bacterium]|nr:glycoside hydrolase family 130 protein [Phycisphaerae bacterium]
MIQAVELKGIKRHPKNPILTKDDVPYESSLVFNAGVTKFNGKYVMTFRNDYGFTKADFRAGKGQVETNIGLAYSDNGIDWEVSPKPCFSFVRHGANRAYDPRLTVIDSRCYMCFAVDGDHGVCGGIAVTDDFDHFEILHITEPDNRNMVLFPEKFGGEFVRLDRPFSMYGKGGELFDTWISRSKDGVYWGKHRFLFGADDIPFCNSKTGPAAPPIKTNKGWLTTFHAVEILPSPELDAWDPKGWNKIYYAGIMLLDPHDPSKIIAIADAPILAPREEYEMKGFRGSAIFPGGMILEDSGEVKIYYGAADTVMALAITDVDYLLKLCLK